jgi:serine phosphatase RsbU (regulator of sigma subunit)
MVTHRHRRRGSGRRRPHFELVRWAPFLILALVSAADLSTPGPQRFDRFLVAAPALAAASWSVAGTVRIGVLAAAIELVLSLDRPASARPTSFAGVVVIVMVTAAAGYASHVRELRERDLSQVSAVAETAQQMVLRPLPHHLATVDLDLLYESAAAHARIGGDFYEALHTPHGVRLILGDVQGNGLPAVEVASVLLGSFREAAYDAADLPALALRLEQSMTRYGERSLGTDAAERFATTLLLEIPGDRAVARVLNCGHPPPLLLRGGEVLVLDPTSTSLPLNLSVLEPYDHKVDDVPFGTGDRILLYTDGVSETRDRTGTFYPLTERLRQWTAEPSSLLLERLGADLTAFGAGPRDDDVAAVVVLRHTVDPHG